MENDNNTNDISFSILIGCYYSAKFIEETIKSVINQTYNNWELIIVDDGSIDNTNEIIKPYLKNQKIKLIIHEENKGTGQVGKTLVENASKNIIGLLDHDDKLHKKALEIMAKAYRENPEFGFIYSTHWECDSNLKNPRISKAIGPVDPQITCLNHNIVSHFKTFRKDIYKKTEGFNPKLKYGSDIDIIFKLEEVTKFKFIDVPLYYYRQHKSGISKKKKYQMRLDHYISRLKAYHRRLNTNVPNITLNDLYLYYYNITFYKLISVLNSITKKCKILLILNSLLNNFSFLHNKLKTRFKKIRSKKKIFYIFENIVGHIIK